MPVKADSLTVVSWAVHAVKSVVNQSFRDWELIMINDRSEADMSELKEYLSELRDGRIRGGVPNGAGVVAARNTAAAMAEGEFLLPLDADDSLPNRSLEIMLDHWPGDGIVYGDTLIFGQDFQRKYKSRKYNFELLLDGLIMPVGSLHLKSDWEKIGGWHPDMEDGLEDWEYWIRMGENGVCGHYVPEITYQYRRRTAGRYRNLKSAPDGYKKAYNTMRDLHVDVFNGRFPVGCCSGRRTSKVNTTVRRPEPVADETTTRSLDDSKWVRVLYTGGRKGAFQLVGRRSGDRYNVPGTGKLVRNLRTGKDLVEKSDAIMLTKLNRGRDFEIL
jgi:glycosyltransferase involved in cell wall biosynthesis